MDASKTVIGVAGRIRAGKETVGHSVARALGAVELMASAALYDSLELFGVPAQRKNTQSLSTFLRQTFGQEVLQAPLIRTIEASSAPITIIGSLRRQADFSDLKRHFRFYLIFVHAPLEERYARFSNALKSDLDATVSFDDFRALDSAEAEHDVEGLRAAADFVIDNGVSLHELESAVKIICGRMTA